MQTTADMEKGQRYINLNPGRLLVFFFILSVLGAVQQIKLAVLSTRKCTILYHIVLVQRWVKFRL